MTLDQTAPCVRPAGRVIVVDGADRILLIRSEDPSIDVPVLWLTPGGGCEATETPRQAAIRELWEETGIRVADVGPCVWRRRHTWRFGACMIDSREDFFLMRCDEEVNIDPALLSKFEQSIFREYRWWTVDEMLRAANEFFVPRNLPELLRQLLSGHCPSTPVEIGD